MLETKTEIQELIRMIFASDRIEINDKEASRDDVIALCERLSKGKERVYVPRYYKKAKRIEKILIHTY